MKKTLVIKTLAQTLTIINNKKYQYKYRGQECSIKWHFTIVLPFLEICLYQYIGEDKVKIYDKLHGERIITKKEAIKYMLNLHKIEANQLAESKYENLEINHL